jgi:hypothetical protein
VLPFPFYFLNNNQAMNVRPKHYSWKDFCGHVIDLPRCSFSWRALFRRFRATSDVIPRWMNLLRAASTEGFGRLRYYREICRRLSTDRQFPSYFAQEMAELPRFYVDLVRKDLGPLWDWLPKGGLYHDPYAYRESEQRRSPSWHETVLASTPSANGASSGSATIRTPSACSPSA